MSTPTVEAERAGDMLDPASMRASQDQEQLVSERQQIDASCRAPVTLFIGSAVGWLMVGTLFGLLASIKLHSPEFLAEWSWLTFGRVRPAHLTVVIFGWAALIGLGVSIWTMCRLCRTPLIFPQMLVIAGILWDIGVAAGLYGILSGQSNSIEYLEFPHYATFLLFAAFALCAIWGITTFTRRKAGHVYVSIWYIFGAFFWFPWIYSTVQILENSPWAVQGVPQETVHWWFGHNVLGVLLTPMGLAAIYYLLPKVIGRPVHSYYLSILGFWSLALFYNWAGGHHLVGGPVPAWLITLSIVASVMMFIPVISTAINHHLTAYQHLDMLRKSPVLRFVVFGAVSYTLVSFQGSMMSVRVLNEPFHFTHHTIAHAHLGLYAFYTMVMFGAIYYILPRLTGREFLSRRLINVQFWAAALGITLMFLALTVGGAVQGFEWNHAAEPVGKLIDDYGFLEGLKRWFAGMQDAQENPVPFMTVVREIIPYMWARSVSGTMLFISHIALFILVFWNIFGGGVKRTGTLLFPQRSDA